MSLIECLDCGNQVSDQAPTFPSCGGNLKEPELKVEASGEGYFLQTLNAGCIVIFVIIRIN